MVYVDEIQHYPTCILPHKYWCHLTADSREELHAFAEKLGLKFAWFQAKSSVPHYDLTPNKRDLALKMGAVVMSAKDQARKRRQEYYDNLVPVLEDAQGINDELDRGKG